MLKIVKLVSLVVLSPLVFGALYALFHFGSEMSGYLIYTLVVPMLMGA
jgi:hypothetical protein